MSNRGEPDFGITDPSVAFVNKDDLTITTEWLRLLTRLSQLTPERALSAVAVTASPFTYTASTIGHLLITGGTVSAVVLTRGKSSINCPLSGFIPLAGRDAVTITYSVLPTVTFVPSARA